ncbi:unnamed protein product [Sphenostylis stenocarpa]|uniref:DUF676 domain-containing protein n=1 Tax=Sphenostylis stenocarpa TaxID=92480 RepID=A0AA86SRL2_9FABA|nr:unnamed protein product [Sphenostylis stenocarpa]
MTFASLLNSEVVAFTLFLLPNTLNSGGAATCPIVFRVFFFCPMEEEKNVCASESVVEGSRDVWSSEPSLASSADHLVVMVNGILGRTTDWKYASEQFVKELPDKVFVHCSERNVSMHTLDGVDVMGERLAEEVLEVIRSKPNMRKISFVAHSVGGLVARYAIGRLYRPPEKGSVEDSCNEEGKEATVGTIGGLEAMNFIAVATPHLGSRGNKQVPFLLGVPAFEKVASCVIHFIFRRTGRHLFLTDDDEGRPPLLQRMIEDYGDLYFMSALRSFKRRFAYSNVDYDHIVGWRTSSIRRQSELANWKDTINERYPHVVYEEHCKACSDSEQYDILENDNSDKIEEELVTGLSRVSWEKIDVSFRNSKNRFAAHTIIQVKDDITQIEGADVIQHMIDHFLL